MESKYFKRENNGTIQYVYTSDVYDLTINNKGGQLDNNLSAKGNTIDTVINQLTSDLSNTTLKFETLMNVFSECTKGGMIPEELLNNVSAYIYGSQTEPSKKHR